MTERPGSARGPAFGEDELRWTAENLPAVRRWIVGQRFLFIWLSIGFVFGLAAHIGGYLLAAAAAGEPVGLIADLLTNLGVALWTGGVLVVFIQVLPEGQRRSAARYLEQAEAALREQGRLHDDDR